MSNLTLAEKLVATLPTQQPGLFNPWATACEYDDLTNGPRQKLERLAMHLNCQPEIILVGEAPGYQGCRYSGVAFTSERLLLEGAIPRIRPPEGRLSVRRLPFSEPSATIIWKTLYELNIARDTVLWNAVQLHPYKPGEPWSNRTPNDNELALGVPALRLLTEAFPSARLVAVGQKAAGILAKMDVQYEAAVRHPANGGARLFANGLRALFGRSAIRKMTS